MENTTKKFYVYVYIDPETLEPFYIGKGQGRRDKFHLSEAKCWDGKYTKGKNGTKLARIRKILQSGRSPIISKVFITDNEMAACEEEARLVKLHRDTLTNIVDGGTGGRSGELNTMYGKTHSEEAKQKIRDIRAKEKLNPNYTQRMITSNPRSIPVTDGKTKYLSIRDYGRINGLSRGVSNRHFAKGLIYPI